MEKVEGAKQMVKNTTKTMLHGYEDEQTLASKQTSC
jgi:hypothetical protein